MPAIKPLFFILFAHSLFATYVGNPSSPGILQTGLFNKHNYLINVTSGYVNDITWDKKIKPENQPEYISLEKVNEFEVRSNWAYVSLIFLRHLEFYTYLGVSKESMDWRNKANFSHKSEFKTQNHFSYAVGVKALLFQFAGLGFGLNLQYFSLPSSNEVVQRIQNIHLPFVLGEQYLKMKEWQTVGGISYKFGPFSPYVGIKYTTLRLRVKSTTNLPTLKFDNRENWGVFTGLSLNFADNFYITVEGRFIDEEAVGTSFIAAF